MTGILDDDSPDVGGDVLEVITDHPPGQGWEWVTPHR
jgi:hypothetical protein